MRCFILSILIPFAAHCYSTNLEDIDILAKARKEIRSLNPKCSASFDTYMNECTSIGSAYLGPEIINQHFRLYAVIASRTMQSVCDSSDFKEFKANINSLVAKCQDNFASFEKNCKHGNNQTENHAKEILTQQIMMANGPIQTLASTVSKFRGEFQTNGCKDFAMLELGFIETNGCAYFRKDPKRCSADAKYKQNCLGSGQKFPEQCHCLLIRATGVPDPDPKVMKICKERWNG